MRLQRLQLRRYGCFDNADIELACEPGRLTIIVAPNGAGKSVLRRAFHDLLFDIPMQSPMKFRHGYSGMALHAEAIDADGTAFSFGWVRGGKPARITSDADRFAAVQRGVTPQQLERLFALDTAGLRKGGTDLNGGTTLAGALLAGTGELAPAKSVRATIDKRRQENWGPNKSKPPLNAAAAKLDAERRKFRAAVQRPEKREREEHELENQQQQYERAKRARDDALAEARRLSRVALTRPHLHDLQEAEDWLAAHPDAPALPAGLDGQLAEARGAVATAQAIHDGARRAFAGAVEAAGRIERDAAATRLAERLNRLPGMLGEVEKTGKDIAERRAEHAAKLEDVRSTLRDIGVTVPDGRMDDVIPTVGLVADARGAITQEAALRKALDLSVERLTKAKATQAAAKAEPIETPTLPDGLVALLAEIRADRNPAQHAAETDEQARGAAAEVIRSLAMTPGWTGTADALRALALPDEAAFERLDGTRQAAAAHAEEARRHRADLAARQVAAGKSLAALRERPLPDAASIAAARAERDRGLRLVLRRAFGVPPTPVEESGYAGAEPVALVFERQVRSADALADRRTAELERVQEAERLGRVLAELAEPLREAETNEAAAVQGLGSAENAWVAAVAPLGFGLAATMVELRKALAGRARLVEAMFKADVASSAQGALRDVHYGWAVRLAALLDVPPAPLGALLGRADDRVTAVRTAERSGAKRQAALEAAESALRDAAEAQARADRGLEEWRESWAGLLDRLHRPAEESPQAVSAVLDGIGRLDKQHREAVLLERRINDMQDDLDRFAADVAALASTLAEPAAATPTDTGRALIARANAATNAESAWRQAQLGLEQARTAVADGEAGVTAAKTKLAAIIAACGAGTADEAERRVAASHAHAERTLRRNTARTALTEHGDGLSIAVLRTEADAVPANDMTAKRREAEEAATRATAGAEEAAVKLDQLRTALEADADATAAIDARADYEAAKSEFSRRLEDQLVLNLASKMLSEAMRSVEEDMGGSSLARVSQTFAAVTDGAYGLETRDGAEGEELHAVEHAFPQERKSLDELSEGTRDQLYLALRMVALRDHCAAATALPFIADDILQTFDDTRALAALRTLSDLSKDVQVIVLTHHAHLRQVAAQLGGERVHLLSL